MSDPNDNSIPILHEVLVPGQAAQRREPESGAAAPTAPAAPAAPTSREAEELREPGLAAAPEPEPEPEPELAPQPVLTPEETRAPEPVLAPEPAVATAASSAAAAHPAARAHPAHHARPAHHAHGKKHSRSHHAAEAEHARDAALAASAGVFDRAEPPTPLEAGATVPPDFSHEAGGQGPSGVDAELIAERLRERFAGLFAGDGRGIIEARCRSAVQEHTTRLVDQITREVVLALESEMTGWVREAVEAEIARRTGGTH
ncbi:DUF2486 family protein [Paraburkholderia rhynchosiae]|uniref:DUF2486 domain-containing protein n=1 Tax=Paraburkholderia rhynchosiae TaxID=487049 RepID=A0A2N7WXE6_9BURK|nr:DUF2486 family protein [Paraburkholderia rhynchosiae]PMS34139.1 DUF2486 domain-containing protein [Paraburkholderia rhynchosiae]CAB3637173.1 hypothetical protein LMG27174_00159 [Paraburkholderia rhynchosiae]